MKMMEVVKKKVVGLHTTVCAHIWLPTKGAVRSQDLGPGGPQGMKMGALTPPDFDFKFYRPNTITKT